MKHYAVTGARATTKRENDVITKAVSHHRGHWHIGDATGADAKATEQAQKQGDTVTTYKVDKTLGRAGYAVRSMRMLNLSL